VIVLLLSCSTSSGWTEERALAPTLAALDANKNGTVEETEYESVRYRGRAFSDIDADKDGTLDADELADHFFRSDPGNTGLGPPDGARKNKKKKDAEKAAAAQPGEPGVPPPGGGGAAASQGGPPKPGVDDTDGTGDKRVAPTAQDQQKALQGGTLRVLLSLREDLVFTGHAAPSEDALRAAADAGSLYTSEARGALDQLEAAADDAGLSFPPSLRRAALAGRAVDASLPPTE
jgi:hypothetical protein